MKPVQSSLKKWMQENKNFKENYVKIKRDVLNDPEIKEFLSLHSHLTQREIDKSLIKLYEYKTQSKQCNKCSSLETCPNMLQGYSPILHVEGNEIHLSYEKCHTKKMDEEKQRNQKLIQSLYMPKDILQATINNIDIDPKRSTAILEIRDFLEQVKNGMPKKGIYFSGSFGIGKTYFLGALANALKDDFGISSMLIYMPEFVREIRSSLKDDSINEKVDFFKKANVLMFDDIGAEMQSAWFRDEILGSILQYRMMEGLPVFFTSNYTLEQLEGQLATTRSGVETVKAGRIIERIKQVSKEVKVFGDNRRS